MRLTKPQIIKFYIIKSIGYINIKMFEKVGKLLYLLVDKEGGKLFSKLSTFNTYPQPNKISL